MRHDVVSRWLNLPNDEFPRSQSCFQCSDFTPSPQPQDGWVAFTRPCRMIMIGVTSAGEGHGLRQHAYDRNICMDRIEVPCTALHKKRPVGNTHQQQRAGGSLFPGAPATYGRNAHHACVVGMCGTYTGRGTGIRICPSCAMALSRSQHLVLFA